MSWLFGLIWLALLLCFIAGVLLASLWWLWHRRGLVSNYEKRRLAGEAESDRLRLRVSSLKAAEIRAEDLGQELERVRGEAARLPLIETEVRELRTKTETIPDLEHQILNLQIRSDEADSLDSQVAKLSAEANRVGELEAEVIELRDEAGRIGSLESEIADLRVTAERTGELEGRLETLTATADRVPELEGRLETVSGELKAVSDELKAANGELQAASDELKAANDQRKAASDELAAANRQVETGIVRVGQLQDQLSATESDLGTARQQASDAAETDRQFAALRVDHESLNAKVAHRDGRIESLEAELAQRPEAAEVEALRQDLAHRSEASRAAEAGTVEARAEVAGMRMELDAARSEVESARVESAAARTDGAAKGAELDGIRAELASRSSEVDAIRAESASRGSELDMLRSETGLNEAALMAARSELASAAEVRTEQQREIQRLTAELGETKTQLKRVTDRTETDAEVASHLRAEVVEAQAAASRVADLEVEIEAARRYAAQAKLVPERDETIAKLEKRLAKTERSLEKAKTKAKSRSEAAQGAGQKDRKKSSKKKREEQRSSKKSSKRSEAKARRWQKGTTKLGTPGADHTDDLKVIHGIGPVMEQTLNGFGIQTWEQVAAFSPSEIDKVTEAIETFPGRIERDDWVGGAQRLLEAGHSPDGGDGSGNASGGGRNATTPAAKRPAKSKKSTPRSGGSWQRGTTKLGTPGAGHTDDLKVVNGIGPVMETTLNGFGIQSWEQLSAFTEEDIATVTEAIAAFPGRIDRDEWVAQAADLVKRFPLNSPYDRPDRKNLLNKR